MLQLY